MGKRDGLAVRVNSHTPDILAFTETWLSSRIINNPIILNNTSYKGEKGEIDLEGGYWVTKGHSEPVWMSVTIKLISIYGLSVIY